LLLAAFLNLVRDADESGEDCEDGDLQLSIAVHRNASANQVANR
jgi:hypothetical protein